MRINTNVPALQSQRILGQTNAAVGRSIGRLSSGFRINRAADDSAGLGIANQLRADTRALKQAARNAEQANSLLQVAEGATQVVQNIVDRMKELAMQSASDNVNDVDRGLIQAEFSQLQAEITRIVDTTKFQGGFLLKSVAASAAQAAVPGSTHTAAALTVAGTGNGSAAATGTYTGSGSSITLTYDLANTKWVASDGGTPADFTSGGSFQGVAITITDGGTAWANGDTLTLAVTAPQAAQPEVLASGGPRTFLVSSSGAYAGADGVTISSLDLQLATLGLDASTLADKAGAQAALTAIDTAIGTISGVFGDIGAAQNRIDYATANVRTAIENFAAAESTIRDADMAAEMTEFTKNQILQQAGVAMLAQANAAPQLVLQLLQ